MSSVTAEWGATTEGLVMRITRSQGHNPRLRRRHSHCLALMCVLLVVVVAVVGLLIPNSETVDRVQILPC